MGVSVSIKREDLNDPEIQGNKWLKLKPLLIDASKKDYRQLLTFGGCYSNHIYATAAAGHRFGYETIGIIRGPEPEKYSETLKFAKSAGMQLKFISREDYRVIRSGINIEQYLEEFQPAYFIPEGGATDLAIDSCASYIAPFKNQYDVICCACGTGSTFAGFIKGLDNQGIALGFAVLKGASFLYDDITSMLNNRSQYTDYSNWSLKLDYHFGGYAKSNQQLESFILEFYQKHKIPLEPVYTGKMLFGLFDLIKKGYFEKGTEVLAIHTGGLQGLSGFPELQKSINIK